MDLRGACHLNLPCCEQTSDDEDERFKSYSLTLKELENKQPVKSLLLATRILEPFNCAPDPLVAVNN